MKVVEHKTNQQEQEECSDQQHILPLTPIIQSNTSALTLGHTNGKTTKLSSMFDIWVYYHHWTEKITHGSGTDMPQATGDMVWENRFDVSRMMSTSMPLPGWCWWANTALASDFASPNLWHFSRGLMVWLLCEWQIDIQSKFNVNMFVVPVK